MTSRAVETAAHNEAETKTARPEKQVYEY